MKHGKFNGYDVHLVESVEELDKIRKVIFSDADCGLDTETDGLDVQHNIAGVCISGGKGYMPGQYHGFYLPVRHVGYDKNLPVEAVIAFTQEMVDKKKTILWNRNFDNTMLEKDGYVAPCPGHTHDAQCMAHLVKGDSFPALKDFAEDYLKFSVLHYSDNNAEEGSFKTTDPTTSFIYAAGDPILTVLLARKLWADYPYIRKIYPLDNKFAEVMRRVMYNTNLYLDHSMIQKMLDDNLKQQQIVKKEIFAMTGYTFRLTSTADIADALGRFVTLTKKTKKGKLDVSKDVLKEIDHPLAKLITKARNLEKFRGTYLAKMLNFPQPFHINYQHCNVATGRLSSGGSKGNSFFAPFNIQNVPKVEIIRNLHYAPVSSPILYYGTDDPYKPLSENTPILTPSGVKYLKELHPGDMVRTPKGDAEVVACGDYEGKLWLVEQGSLHLGEGTKFRHDGGEWITCESTKRSTDRAMYLDLGEFKSVCIPHGAVQTRTLQDLKMKGGMRDAFICPEPSPLYKINGVDYEGDELVDGILAKNHPNAEEIIEPWVWLSADYCVDPEAWVTTARGPVQMKYLRDGELVLTPWGYKPCRRPHSTGKKKVVRIKLKSGETLKCSLDHPICVRRDGVLQWITAGQLRNTDYIFRLNDEKYFVNNGVDPNDITESPR